jgi:UDP-N-acetylmuramate dehydrogenase
LSPKSDPVALSELTTIRVGGKPRSLIRAETAAELYQAARDLDAGDRPWLLLGGGSNTVIADDFSDHEVLLVSNRGIEVESRADKRVRVRVQAGENWDEFVAWAVAQGYAGIEAMSGIPGSVGATPVQNVGAYGQEVAETITRAEFLDLESDELKILSGAEFEFSYRDSALKRGRRGVIGWVEFELQRLDGLSVPMASGQITNHLGLPYGSQLPLTQVRDTVIELRSGKGMVVREDDPDSVSCGSFFTNPIVSYEKSVMFPSDMLRWEMRDGTHNQKLSAGWLIEHSGVEKGFALPGSRAAISSKHALAITNRGGASATEILELARYVQMRVHDRWGVALVAEPNLIGFGDAGL